MDNYMIVVTCIFISAVMSASMCFLFSLLKDKGSKIHECVFSKFIQCDCNICDIKDCCIAQYHIRKMINRELNNVRPGKEG